MPVPTVVDAYAAYSPVLFLSPKTGVEIAKNVALAGIKALTVHDTVATTVADLGTQFFLKEARSSNLQLLDFCRAPYCCVLYEVKYIDPDPCSLFRRMLGATGRRRPSPPWSVQCSIVQS